MGVTMYESTILLTIQPEECYVCTGEGPLIYLCSRAYMVDVENVL